MTASRARATCFLVILSMSVPAVTASDEVVPGLAVVTESNLRSLSLDGAEPFHRTPNEVVGERLIDVPGGPVRLALWSEVEPEGRVAEFYAISLDGNDMATVRQTSYVMELRHGRFDPAAGVPAVAAVLTANDDADLYIVQFVTQPLEEFRAAIAGLGGAVPRPPPWASPRLKTRRFRARRIRWRLAPASSSSRTPRSRNNDSSRALIEARSSVCMRVVPVLCPRQTHSNSLQPTQTKIAI